MVTIKNEMAKPTDAATRNSSTTVAKLKRQAGQHALQCNRLIHIAKRMMCIAKAAKDDQRRMQNHDLNEVTKKACLHTAKLMGAEGTKEADDEEQVLMHDCYKAVLASDLDNIIQSATCERLAEKRNILRNKLLARANAEVARANRTEDEDAKKA